MLQLDMSICGSEIWHCLNRDAASPSAQGDRVGIPIGALPEVDHLSMLQLKAGVWGFEDFLRNGLVEYLDVNEEDNALIALYEENIGLSFAALQSALSLCLPCMSGRQLPSLTSFASPGTMCSMSNMPTACSRAGLSGRLSSCRLKCRLHRYCALFLVPACPHTGQSSCRYHVQ